MRTTNIIAGRKHKFTMVGLLGVIILLLTGCWNKTELSDIAFVTALGVDKAKDNKGLVISFQVVIPGNVTTGITGGSAQGIPVIVFSSKAKNIIEAGRNTTKMVSRRLFYSHCNLVVISEEIAKFGINDIMDALERDPEFRTTATVVVAQKSSAKQIVDSLTPLDKIPANKVVKALEWTERVSGENLVVNVDDTIKALVSKGKQPIIGGFTFSGDRKKSIQLSNNESTITPGLLKAGGIAIFKGDKLKGWFQGQTAKGVLRLQNKLEQTPEYVNWNEKKEAVGMKILRSNSVITAHLVKGKPKITVEINEEGNIIELSTPVDLTDPRMILQLQKAFEKKVKSETMKTIAKSQNKKSDIFGFGDKFYQSYPRYWKTVEDDWDDIFSEMAVEVKVNTYIRRTGNRSKSFLSSDD